MKRASRTGPLAVINEGIALVAPSRFAAPTSGFVPGLEPPTVGWEWHIVQLLPLKAGPSPTPGSANMLLAVELPETEKICLKIFCPPPQNFCMSTESANGKRVAFPPALGRGPGSV